MSKASKLATVYYNFSTLLEAGMHVLRALDSISSGLQGNLQKTFSNMRSSIYKGKSIAEAIAEQRGFFSKLDIRLVEAAEMSGKLSECFKLLSYWHEFRVKMLKKMKSGLILPIFVLTIALMALPIPSFVFGQINMFEYLTRAFGPLVAIFIISSFIIFLYKFSRNSHILSLLIDSIIARIPVLGKAIQELSISRFTRSFGMLYKAGVPMIESLEQANTFTGNTIIAKFFEGGTESARQGNKAIKGFSQQLPSEYLNLWDIGEETGELEKAVDKISEISTDRAFFLMKECTKWFPIIIYVLICIFIIYMIFKLSGVLYSTDMLESF